MPMLVPKGSVAVDGISLTIASVGDAHFAVALIPATLARTAIGLRRVGDQVNIETDILARSVYHMLRFAREEGGLSLAHLQDHGFA